MSLFSFIFILQGEDLNTLLNYFFDLGNPVFYSLIITFIVYLTITSNYTIKIIPFEERFLRDKQDLEKSHLNEIQSLINMNPDPILKIDHLFRITHFNETAVAMFQNLEQPHILLTQLSGMDDNRELQDIRTGKVKTLSELNENFTFTLRIKDNTFYGRIMMNKERTAAIVNLHDSTAYFRFEKEYYHMIDLLEEEKQYSLDKIEQEKFRIAQDLHDGVGQVFSTAKLHLIRLTNYIDNRDIMDVFESSMHLLSQGIDELKHVTFDLRPKVLAELGLALAVKDMISLAIHGKAISLLYSFEDDFQNIDERLELAVYRIIQELLSNALKHSHATECYIQLHKKENVIKILYYDNGCGFNFEEMIHSGDKMKNMGLKGMAERTELFKGVYKFQLLQTGGMRVTFDIPFKSKNT